MLHQKSTEASLKADGAPPILGTWGRVYAAIVVYLVAIIIAFGVFTAVFNK
jgi:hypothetical protein